MGAWEAPFDHGGVAPPKLDNDLPDFPIGKFMALHANLIPKGPNRGKILVWSHTHYAPASGPPSGQTRVLRWAIVDAVTKTFQNFEILLDEGQGDLFCAGHAWNGDGDLVVAGGTFWHGDPVLGWTGAKLMYLYRSNTNTWERGPDLDEPRWYPSVLSLGKAPPPAAPDKADRMLVAGGTNGSGGSTPTAVNSYQVWVPDFTPLTPVGRWQPNATPPPGLPNTFAGPLGGYPYRLDDYPRLHLLSNGLAVTAGFRPGSARINHYVTPGTWSNYGVLQSQERVYNSAFTFPYVLGSESTTYDVIVSTGGWDFPSNTITNVVQISKASAGPGAWPAGRDWTTSCATPPVNCPHGDMKYPRWVHNTVVLPDATALAVGGEQRAEQIWCSEAPATFPELLVNGVWKEMAPSPIIRNYHSTALLLPNGKVLVAGGEYRKFHPVADCSVPTPNPTPIQGPSDYQIFAPAYITLGGVRPMLLDPLPPAQTLSVAYGGQHAITYDYLPLGVSVTKVVLMRPGSVTHHSDGNQRCVELAFTHLNLDPPAVQISVPSASEMLPPGYWMLFLITNQGVPSEAGWVFLD